MISLNDLESVVKAIDDESYAQHSFHSIEKDITSQVQQSNHQATLLIQSSRSSQSDSNRDNQSLNKQTLSTNNESSNSIFSPRQSSSIEVPLSAIGNLSLNSSIPMQTTSCSEVASKALKVNSLLEASLLTTKTEPDEQSYQKTVPQKELQNLTSTKDEIKYSKRFTYQNITDDSTDESDSTTNISPTPIPRPPRKSMPKTCQCPNCSVDGGNKSRDSKGKPQHICHFPDCGKVYNDAAHLRRHLDSHSDKKKFICAHCNMGFHRFDNLKRHIERHKLNKGDLLHACQFPDCGKVFANSTLFKRHSLWHRRIFICAYCNAKYTRKDNLTAHINVHMQNADKPNQCIRKVQHVCSSPDCDRIFTELEDLEKHLDYHSIKKNGVTKCQCPNCSVKGGNDTRDSKGRLLHVCPILNCGKTFTRALKIKEHLKRHASDRPYFCTWTGCGYSFSQQSYLNTHKKVHEVSNPNKHQVQKNVVEGDERKNVPDGKFIIMTCDMLPASINIQNKVQLNVYVPPSSSTNSIGTLNDNPDTTETSIKDSISIPAIVTSSTHQIPLAIQEILSEIQTGRCPTKLPFWLPTSELEGNHFNAQPKS